MVSLVGLYDEPPSVVDNAAIDPPPEPYHKPLPPLSDDEKAQVEAARAARAAVDDAINSASGPLVDDDGEDLTTLGIIEATDQDVKRERHMREARERAAYAAPSTPFPSTLLGPPGKVGEIAAYLDSMSTNETPILSLAASLSLVGALAGRRYKSPTGIRTNIYVIGIAETGNGKESARKLLPKILEDSGLLSHIAHDRIMSATALLRSLADYPVRMYCLDEFGKLLKCLTHKNAGSHERQIVDTIMMLFGQAQTRNNGSIYADKETKPIIQPCMCLYAVSTPLRFWDAMTGDDALDGFMNRLLVFEEQEDPPESKSIGDSDEPIPASLSAWCKGVAEGALVRVEGGNLQGTSMHSATTPPALKVVDFDDEANAALDVFKEKCRKQTHMRELWRRAKEHTIRVAMLVAIGIDASEPVVTLACWQWAERLVCWSIERMVAKADELVASSVPEGNWKRCLAAIKRAGPGGCTAAHLSKLTGGMGERDRAEAVRYLEVTEKIRKETAAPPRGGPQRTTYWVA